MKLKKIASLMLAGIMAVSMLAACGEGKDNGGKDDSSSDVTSADSVSSDFYDSLSKGTRLYITSAANNAALNTALQTAVKDFVSDQDVATAFNAGTTSVTGAALNYVVDELDAKLLSADPFKNTKDTTVGVVVYSVGNGVSDKAALEAAVAQFETDINGKLYATGTKDGVDYEYDYSVSASVASRVRNITATDFSVKYVAIAVTQTAEKA